MMESDTEAKGNFWKNVILKRHSETEFSSEDPNTSEMSDGCIFEGRAGICKEFNCHGSSEESKLDSTKDSIFDTSGNKSLRLDKSTDNEEPLAQGSPFPVSPEMHEKLADNLYMAKLSFQRARNITANRLSTYKEEAIEQMKKLKSLVHEDLENPEAPVKALAEDLVSRSTELVEYQKELNRLEVEELTKNMDDLLNTLSSEVKEVAKSAEPPKKEKRPFHQIIYDNGLWILGFLYAHVYLNRYLPEYYPEYRNYYDWFFLRF